MITEAELLRQIEEFCTRHGMPYTSFGMAALGDFNFVDDLRTHARSPKLKTVRKVVEFMEDYLGDKA